MVLKEISIAAFVIGIILTAFSKKYPTAGAIGTPLGLLGMLGIYYFS